MPRVSSPPRGTRESSRGVQRRTQSTYAVSAVFPILSAGDLHGGIVIVSDDYIKPTEAQLVKARFLRDIIAQEVEWL